MESKSSKRKLDAIEKQLLDQVMIADAARIPLLVGDLLLLDHIGSQATLHGRIQSIKKLGYVKLIENKVDNRKKNVVPSNLAIQCYKLLCALLARSCSK